MDFARDHLKQLGWQEGAGLGKGQHGIVEALKPRLKFDTAGIGHDPAKEFTDTWWSEVYNSAASGITVTEAADGCQLAAKVKKKKKRKTKVHQSAYSNFVPGGTLVGDQMTENSVSPVEEATGQVSEAAAAVRLGDDELLAACGGRTAHKGARHGHKMDGKLARILAQEAAIASVMAGGCDTEEQTVTKKKKKKRKHADVEEQRSLDDGSEVNGAGRGQMEVRQKKSKISDPSALGVATDECLTEKRKKKKKRKTEQEN